MQHLLQTGHVWGLCYCHALYAHLLWWAVMEIKNRLIRDVVCPISQVCTCSKIDKLEALFVVTEDDVVGCGIMRKRVE